jgi:hypothetical protein
VDGGVSRRHPGHAGDGTGAALLLIPASYIAGHARLLYDQI